MPENLFSVVIPVYGCNVCLDNLYRRITDNISIITGNYEIIFIDDASPDDSWETILNLSRNDNHIKAIRLSRNFGQHQAIMAGLHHANGEWVIVMDCDLQDPPEEIQHLYNKAKEGYDIVLARRIQRQDSTIRKYSSYLFANILTLLTHEKIDSSIGNFGIYAMYVIKNTLKFKEKISSFNFIIRWVGFKVGTIDVQHQKRFLGKSSYNFSKLFNFALINIIYQSDKPLLFIMKTGALFSGISFLYVVYFIYKYLVYDIPVEGWTSLIVSIHFLGGLLLFGLGVVGLYVAKIFDETRDRPLYIVRTKIGL